MSQSPNDDVARRKSSVRERSAIIVSRVGWLVVSIGLLLLLAAVPTALYAMVGSHVPRWSGAQIAALGGGFCLLGLLLGVVATLLGRSRYL